jgi:hypothetical protein
VAFFYFLGSPMLTVTNELQAINIMLGTIGESPINSLEETSGVIDAVTARQILNENAVAVLTEGWHFNSEYDWSFLPNTDGEITVPATIIQADAVDRDVDVAVRGTRLYDKKNHTYKFSAPVKLDCLVLFEFEELPQAAKYYITVRAARVFQNRVVGSETLSSFTERDEVRARVALMRYDHRNADYNMLTGSYSVARTLQR